MKSDDGTLSFGTAIDTSTFDEGIEHVMDKIEEVGTFTQDETSRISSILRDVPTLDIKVVSNASETLATIDQAYAEIDRVSDANKAAISELEKEYNRLGTLASAAYKKATVEGNKEYAELKQKQDVIKSLINERKRVVEAVGEEADKVQQLEQKMKADAEAAQKSSNAHQSLRQQIKALKQEMADLVANGIDEQSEAYKRLVNELGRLTDIQGDISQQGSVMANDEAQIAGLIQGLNGLSGAFTAAEGAVSLFAGENEDLQRIMTKLQSLMAITMGLQQVQQTLNKDSAFSLVTLNGLKEYWNKLLAIGRGEQEAETAATIADTTAQAANTAATTADTTAQAANNTATDAGTVAQGANTAATAVNTTAAVAGTAANIGLAGAFRMVGAAIKSIPVFGWIAAAIGVLIGVISHFIDKAKEQEKAVEDEAKIEEDARKTYAQASAEIQVYQNRINSFNGTKKQEKKLVEELNQKYGTALGRYDSLSQWKSVLTTKGEAYCNMLLKEAEAQAYLNKYTEAFVNLQVVRDKAEAGVYDHWYNTKAGDEASRKEAIDNAQADVDKWLERYKAKMKEAESIKMNFNLNPLQPSSSGGGGSNKTSNDSTANVDTSDYKEAARKQRDAIREMRDEILKWRKDAQSEIDDAVINNMAESQAKEVNQITLDTQRQKEQWHDKLLDLAKSIKEQYKNVYMAQKGATEDGWEKSQRGKMSADDYLKELLGDPKNYKLYYSQLDDITEQGEAKIKATRQKYHDQWVDQYGSTEQKIEALEQKYQETLANAPTEFVPQVIKAFEKQFAELRTKGFKDSIDWESVFGDLSKQSLASLQNMLQKVRTYFKQNKADMSTDDIKDYQEAITKMEDEIASRNPFTALHKALTDIKGAKDDFKRSLKEQTAAQNELTAATEEYNAAIKERDSLQRKVDLGNTLTKYSKDSLRSLNDMILALETKQMDNGALSSTEKEILASLQRIKAQIESNDPFKELGTSLANLKSQLADGNASEATIKTLTDNLNNITSVIGNISDALNQSVQDATAGGDTVDTKITDTIGNLQVLIGQIQNGVNDTSNQSKDALKRAGDDILSIGNALATLRDSNSNGLVDTEQLTAVLQSLQDFIDQAINTSGENADEYTSAVEKAKVATNNLTDAKDKSNKADRDVNNNQNKITQSYKRYASQLRSTGSVIKGVGDQAKNLAEIFSDDVADGIGKAIDTVTSLLDAASTVVDALGDTAKSVTDTVSTTADAAAQGMKATATAASASIQTVEKASVILAVISAALQVATAIANLFNNDAKKQKEIENLQQRIDQLQWELDNSDAVRLQERYGDAVKRVRDLWLEAYNEVADLNAATMRSNNWFVRSISTMRSQNEILAKSVEKIADAYAKVDYSADKALGGRKYDEARKELENLAEQQILLQKQINLEEDKKKTDHSKIADWQNTIRENAEKMANVINDMMEDIIGQSAEDIAKELGDAFFEAAAQGEDALEAWHDKVNEIISDITKRMMIQKFLEEPIGQIFDKYKKKWFGDDGRFKGIQNVIDSMQGLSSDLNQVGDGFKEIYDQLPKTVQDMLSTDAERSGESKGIATASQESVDENNARLTTIQGHTYTLVQGMDALNQKSSAILDRLANIDRNTSSSDERLSRMESRLRNIGSTVDDIYTKGINLRTT